MFQFNCILGNRYFWRCMLEHAKRQVHKWKFLLHALSRYVYNRSLFDIFTSKKVFCCLPWSKFPMQKHDNWAIEHFFRVYSWASSKHEEGWENSRIRVMQTRDVVEDLHNFREFSQPLECLYRKAPNSPVSTMFRKCEKLHLRFFFGKPCCLETNSSFAFQN